MTDAVTAPSRMTKAFDWSAVPDKVVRKFLEALLTDAGDPEGLIEIATWTPERRRRETAKRAGSPPKESLFIGSDRTAVVDYVRGPWLRAHPAATAKVVEKLSVGLRKQAPTTQAARVAWIGNELNRGLTMRKALRSAFRDTYKVSREAKSSGRLLGAGTAASSHALVGRGTEGRALYEHQRRTHEALNQWIANRSQRSGLVVLPTGAGKTATTVTWLLSWLREDDARRVLWLAHQTELVDQAARAFIDWSRTQPKGFARRMRVIHGTGSAASTLFEAELAVAVATMQSVRPGKEPNKTAALREFTRRPTIVVVDEAHRSAGDTYTHLLDVLTEASGSRVLGLTATPNPSGVKAASRMINRFQSTLISVDPDELVRQGILARPTFHKVETKLPVHLTVAEARAALSIDFSPAQLKRLAVPARNQLIVDRWLADRVLWRKTLVFATSIDHAEDLTALFNEAGVEARALHSRTQEKRPGETLDWFRSSPDDPVLVSVGMLAEGVDLPTAETAFLARPTTSPVLLRQMIGRVLRGPRSGGTKHAHLVTFHDEWDAFTGTMEPVDLARLPGGGTDLPVPERRSRFITEAGEPLPASVLEQVRRLYRERATEVAHGAAVVRADLAGFLETAEMRIPVLSHQQASFDALIDTLITGHTVQLRTAAKYFADDPLPHPAERHLSELLRQVRETATRPAFTSCRVVLSADATAAAIIDAGQQLTTAERAKMIAAGWADGGQLSYPTREHWEEAVDAAVRDLNRRALNDRTSVNPESISKLVKARLVERDPKPLFREVLLEARELLDSADTRRRLQVPPEIRWSKRPLATAHAHWRPTSKGPVIVLSLGLQISPKYVSDELLKYLMWHELLHHVLPGHGHDAEFRRLEATWPGALRYDMELDTLHERVSTANTGKRRMK